MYMLTYLLYFQDYTSLLSFSLFITSYKYNIDIKLYLDLKVGMQEGIFYCFLSAVTADLQLQRSFSTFSIQQKEGKWRLYPWRQWKNMYWRSYVYICILEIGQYVLRGVTDTALSEQSMTHAKFASRVMKNQLPNF